VGLAQDAGETHADESPPFNRRALTFGLCYHRRMASRPRKPDRDPLDDLRALDQRLRDTRPTRAEAPATPAPEAARPRGYDELVDVAVSLTSNLDLTDILDRIVDGIIRGTGCERGFVILMQEDGSLSMFTGRTRENQPWDERSAREISGTIVDRVAHSHELFLATDLERMDDLRTSDSILEHQIRSAVCLPLLYKNRLIGVIYADSGFVIPRFADADRAMLRAFSANASLAIESARQQGELKQRSDELETQNLTLSRQLAREYSLIGMISKSKRMLDVFETVERIAPLSTSVLIEGESGTGKELLAQAIHKRSPRRERPFEAINCTAIPRELVESILFGHVRGAFTGADSDRPGLFELAQGGSLFLDEIGDMPGDVQAKLLRVLQERELRRVGETGPMRKVDVRIISATNRNLLREIQEGRFREDLYHRLNGAPLSLPPLRERREDIIPLAEHILQKYAADNHLPPVTLSRDARAFLLANPWVGNVRALKAVVEWGFAFQDADRVVHAEPLERYYRDSNGSSAATDASSGTLHEQMDRFEESLIRRALAEHDNNVTAAAKAVSISRPQFYQKLRKYGIEPREADPAKPVRPKRS